jgi:hypothetical protein
MLRLATDENVHGDIIKGLRHKDPELDLVRVVDIGLAQTEDTLILDWAAQEGRILVTADLNTMVGFARERVLKALPMPGVLALRRNVAVGPVIDDILLVAQCQSAEEMKDQVLYVPL